MSLGHKPPALSHSAWSILFHFFLPHCVISFSPLLQSRPQGFFPVHKMCIPQLLSHQFEFLLRCNQLFLEKCCIHFFFCLKKKSQLMNKVYLDRSVKKTGKDKKIISVMPEAPVFAHFLFRFCHHPPFPLLFFFVVGHPSRCIPYTTFRAKKNIKRKKKTEKM